MRLLDKKKAVSEYYAVVACWISLNSDLTKHPKLAPAKALKSPFFLLDSCTFYGATWWLIKNKRDATPNLQTVWIKRWRQKTVFFNDSGKVIIKELSLFVASWLDVGETRVRARVFLCERVC